jgi:FdhD protein
MSAHRPRPQISCASRDLTFEVEAVDERGETLATAHAGGAEILYFIEDVGRHNAVDAIAGRMWLDAVDGSDKIFYTTGRLTSEMVIRAAQMNIPFLVSRSGLTKMGYEIAERIGITMFGRAVGSRYLLFTGRHRFVKAASPATASSPALSCS